MLHDFDYKKSPSVLVVTNPAMADALTKQRILKQLTPFFGQTCTVLEAAQQTNTKANTMLSQVKRLQALGLIKVVKEQRRKGRSIKHYRAVADVFFVPYEITTADTLEAMMAERDKYWATQLRKGVVHARAEDVGSWGTRIYVDDRHRLQIQTAVTPEKNHTMLDKDRPAALSAWRDSVYLDYEDAKALQREMFALLLKYQRKEGAQRYIVRMGMAPLLSND